MRLTRRYQVLPEHWYCQDNACLTEGSCGSGPASETEATAHARETGREVRVTAGSTVTIKVAEKVTAHA